MHYANRVGTKGLQSCVKRRENDNHAEAPSSAAGRYMEGHNSCGKSFAALNAVPAKVHSYGL